MDLDILDYINTVMKYVAIACVIVFAVLTAAEIHNRKKNK